MTSRSAHIPVITTDRLVLRLQRASDLDPFFAMMTPERTAYVVGQVPDRSIAAQILAKNAGSWVLRGIGPLIWTLDGTPIGHGGIYWPLDEDAPELGWMLWNKDVEGHGYATEAMTALLAYAEARMDLPGLWAGIHPDNAASHRVADRIGLIASGETGPDGDVIYRRAA